MSRYFEALNRKPSVDQIVADLRAQDQVERPKLYVLPAPASSARTPSVVAPAGALVATALARTEEIQRLAETFAASVNTAADGRLALAGCATGDGSSIVAAAIALDLTQRLGIRTMVIDGNARRGNFARIFRSVEADDDSCEAPSALRIISTKWHRLEIASLRLSTDKQDHERTCGELNQRIAGFPAAIIDLGTVRTDSRALPLVRENDPVLVVVRAGYTRRQDLLATTTVLTNSAKRIAGVVLNGVEPATPPWLRRFFGKGL